MSHQGQAYTEEERRNIIESLRPFLEMGYSRKKACQFIGFDDTTLSKWAKTDKGVSTKLTSYENVNTALALANIHQALQNEKIKTEEEGDVRVDNSWKLVSKLEDGYKDKLDVTSDDKPLPSPLLANVLKHNSTTEDNEAEEEN